MFKLKKKLKSNSDKLLALLNLHQIDLVLDIGANTGQYAQQLLQNGYAGKIISFEPLKDMYVQLNSNSKAYKNWEIAPSMAIGKETGKTQINISGRSDMSSIHEISDEAIAALPGSEYRKKEEIEIYAFKDIISEYVSPSDGNLFLKADTQGHEMDVLLGTEPILSRFTGIQLELSLFPLYDEETLFQDIVQWLYQRGFESHLVIPGFFSKKLMRHMQIDIVFFRKNE